MKQFPNECFFAWVEEELVRAGSVRFRVKGVSMHPLLRDGRDEVEVHPCDPASVRSGDILLFRYRGRYILHRLLRCRNAVFDLRGDNAWQVEQCSAQDIVGRVVMVYRLRSETLPARYVAISPRETRWRCLADLRRLWRRGRLLLFRILLEPLHLRIQSDNAL